MKKDISSAVSKKIQLKMFLLKIHFVFFLAIFTVIPVYVNGIWCFQCNSLNTPDCASIAPNDTTSEHFKECKAPYRRTQNLSSSALPMPDPSSMFCRKIYQKIHDRNGLEIVIRKCGWVLHEQKDCYSFSAMGHYETVCQCFQDGCNSAFKDKFSLFVLIPSFLIAYLSLINYS